MNFRESRGCAGGWEESRGCAGGWEALLDTREMLLLPCWVAGRWLMLLLLESVADLLLLLDGGWLMVDAGWTLLESGDARCCWLPAVRTVSENGEVSEKLGNEGFSI